MQDVLSCHAATVDFYFAHLCCQAHVVKTVCSGHSVPGYEGQLKSLFQIIFSAGMQRQGFQFSAVGTMPKLKVVVRNFLGMSLMYDCPTAGAASDAQLYVTQEGTKRQSKSSSKCKQCSC